MSIVMANIHYLTPLFRTRHEFSITFPCHVSTKFPTALLKRNLVIINYRHYYNFLNKNEYKKPLKMYQFHRRFAFLVRRLAGYF